MARLRYNNQSGSLNGALTNNGVTITFAVAPSFSTITGGDIVVLELEAGTANFEVVYLTAYTAAALTGTILRGQEGTAGVAHSSGTGWVHGPTVNDFLGTAYNAKAYGVVGDGTTDDAAAIQALVNWVQTAGGTIFFPIGTYLIGTDIDITGSNIHIRGESWATIFKAKAATSVNIFRLTGATFCSFADFTIDGNKANVNQVGVGTQYTFLSGVWIRGGSTNITIEHIYAHDCYVSGVLAQASSYIRVANSRFNANGDNQVFLRAGVNPVNTAGCDNCTVENCIATNGTFSGICALRSDFITFVGNVCSGNGPTAAQGSGLDFEGCRWSSMTGNIVHDNGIQGIDIRHTLEAGAGLHSKDIVLAGNVCYNHASTNGDAGGISVSDTDGITISGNHLSSNGFGINIGTVGETGCTDVLVSGNTVKSSSNNNLKATAGAGPVIVVGCQFDGTTAGDNCYVTMLASFSDCTIVNTGGAGRQGIHYDTGGTGVVQGCTIKDGPDNGINVNNAAGPVYIFDNFFPAGLGTQGRALYENATGGATVFERNYVRGQTNEDFHLTNAGSVARFNDTTISKDSASGTATITAAVTTIQALHGLYKAPTVDQVQVMPTSTWGTSAKWWVTIPDATHIQFNVDAVPGGTGMTFAWRAAI